MGFFQQNSKFKTRFYGSLTGLLLLLGGVAPLNAYVPASFGQRDPFKVPGHFLDLEKNAGARRYDFSDYRLSGVVMGDPNKALFFDPDNRSLILSEGDPVGNRGAKISKILDKEVIVTQTVKDGSGKETQNEISIKID